VKDNYVYNCRYPKIVSQILGMPPQIPLSYRSKPCLKQP
jgi:hypothetical protein